MGTELRSVPRSGADRKPGEAPAWLRGALARGRRWLRGPGDLPGSPFVAARRRLILTNVAVVCVVLTILGVVVYFFNAQTAQQEVDAQLQHYATTGAASVRSNQFVPPPSSDDDHGPQSLVPYSPNTPDIFTVVLDAQGNPVVDFDQVQQLGVPAVTFGDSLLRSGQESSATTVAANGHDYRLYAARVVSHDHDHDQGVVVAGISLYLQNQQEASLIRALAIVYVVVLLATFLSSVLLTERALGPARLAFARQRQFATAASHEMKTPLAVIRSEVELARGLLGDGLALLDDKPPDLAQLRHHLEEAHSETSAATAEVDFMTHMTQDLLLLARDASDTLAHSWAAVDLRALVGEVAERVRPIAESDGVTLHADTMAPGDGAPLWVRGDAGLLRQLLYGLLENAVRYTPEGGSIWAAVREEARPHLLGDHRRHVVIEIRDTGIGIAAEHLASIFEPFYRAVSTTRPLHGERLGTGLGLAMAQWIVRAHGGTIGVRSAEGQGTTFTIELPRANPDEVAPGK